MNRLAAFAFSDNHVIPILATVLFWNDDRFWTELFEELIALKFDRMELDFCSGYVQEIGILAEALFDWRRFDEIERGFQLLAWLGKHFSNQYDPFSVRDRKSVV